MKVGRSHDHVAEAGRARYQVSNDFRVLRGDKIYAYGGRYVVIGRTQEQTCPADLAPLDSSSSWVDAPYTAFGWLGTGGRAREPQPVPERDRPRRRPDQLGQPRLHRTGRARVVRGPLDDDRWTGAGSVRVTAGQVAYTTSSGAGAPDVLRTWVPGSGRVRTIGTLGGSELFDAADGQLGWVGPDGVTRLAPMPR